jgi:hypothetical protein
MPLNVGQPYVEYDWRCIFDRWFRTRICTLILGRRFTLPEGSEDCRQKPSQVPSLTVGQPTRLATPNRAYLWDPAATLVTR